MGLPSCSQACSGCEPVLSGPRSNDKAVSQDLDLACTLSAVRPGGKGAMRELIAILTYRMSIEILNTIPTPDALLMPL